jgi:glycosyltransferase involved in cell wall biosynthesis
LTLPIKIAVYSIALNEAKFIRRWAESAREADLILLADTGSRDKTRFIAKSLGVTTYRIDVTPWRFDVARNASLALIPEDFDICIQLDLDEVLPDGWRKKVEAAWRSGNKWPLYKHVSSRFPDGKVRSYQHHFKIHPRKGFIWKYPIHEVLVQTDNTIYKPELIDLEVDHLMDLSKPRKSYLNLLQAAVAEDPNDWRMGHYLTREYLNNKNWPMVLSTAVQTLSLNHGWNVERSSTNMWASEACRWLGNWSLAESFATEAVNQAPNFYEAWHWRAHIAHLQSKWEDCNIFASKILTLDRQDHHLVKPIVWEWWGYDLMALSFNKLGKHRDAIKYGELALTGNPENERLQKNMKIYLQENQK